VADVQPVRANASSARTPLGWTQPLIAFAGTTTSSAGRFPTVVTPCPDAQLVEAFASKLRIFGFEEVVKLLRQPPGSVPGLSVDRPPGASRRPGLRLWAPSRRQRELIRWGQFRLCVTSDLEL
jgi:hypothetical protein